MLSFYADAKKDADFVLGMATLEAKSFITTGIQEINVQNVQIEKNGCYDLSGRRLTNDNLKPGLYIIDGRKVAIK